MAEALRVREVTPVATDLARLVDRRPRPSSGWRAEALLATVVQESTVESVFALLDAADRRLLATSFPGVVGRLPGVPFAERILANSIRAAAALRVARYQTAQANGAARTTPRRTRLFGPPPVDHPHQALAYERVVAGARRLVEFAPAANDGRGAWVELVGQLGPDTTNVAVLVPGGSAYLTDANFVRYHDRAAGLVEAAGGGLAVLVWTADGWPGGWWQESRTRYDAPLANGLVDFCARLRRELAAVGSRARVTAIGHSYGGAVVGVAERTGLDVDRVLHIASIGMAARGPGDYRADRPRFSLTAPGDWITYVQGIPGLGRRGHPATFPGVVSMPAGNLPDDPLLPDELGEPLGDRAGRPISGAHAHSLVFVRHSDAWRRILHVLTA